MQTRLFGLNATPIIRSHRPDEAIALYQALVLLGHTLKAEKVLECGHAFLPHECLDCTAVSFLSLSCDLRLCPRCARRRASRFISTHYSAIQAIEQPSHLVLTFRSHRTLTRDHLTRYGKAFARLRTYKLWKHAVSGGLAGLELTHNDSGWHPHWHAIIDNTYLNKHRLDLAWKRASNGSFITWIKRCQRDYGAYEVAKYIAKGTDFYSQPHLLTQFLVATKGRRFFSTFGSLYRNLDPTQPKLIIPDNPGTLPPVHSHYHGPALITNCYTCGSTHIKRMDKYVKDPIPKPAVQIPF